MRISYRKLEEFCKCLGFKISRFQCLGNKAQNYHYEFRLYNSKGDVVIDWCRNLKQIDEYVCNSEEYKKLMEV